MAVTPPLSLTLDDGTTWGFDGVSAGLFRGNRSQVTDHPLEDGVPVTDHAYSLPGTVRVRATVTQTPFEDRTFGQPVGPARIQAAKDFLALAANKPLTVVLPDGEVREGMVLRDYSSTDGASFARAFSLELVQVLIAQTTFVVLPVLDEFLEESDAGEQVGESTDDTDLEDGVVAEPDDLEGEATEEDGSTFWSWGRALGKW